MIKKNYGFGVFPDGKTAFILRAPSQVCRFFEMEKLKTLKLMRRALFKFSFVRNFKDTIKIEVP
ncbi:hypothetical protein Lepto1548_21365 (plasmid) [Leptospira interrogans serovar Bataviae]|nr:hypothetical protein Lepto1548_21365 [Leptospira interrogans serovar Bataviae]